MARFILGSLRLLQSNFQSLIQTINDEPALIIREGEGLRVVIFIELIEERIRAVRVVANPDKLKHLASVD